MDEKTEKSMENWATMRPEGISGETQEAEAVSMGDWETQGWRTAEEWQGKRWKAGEEILGRYVVEGELGQGGMGVVYKCLDKVGGGLVAVKALPPELSRNSAEMEEMRENFELVVGLRHPNIAGVRTLEKDGREYFLVMDVAEGANLRKWLREKWKAGRVSPAEAVGVLRQVASALDYAHGERVVHRDVKPGNVMIDGRGRVKVLDFGLAAQIRTCLSRASQAFRETSGTGPYMAPEQWEGRPQGGAVDQYALGVMAYEMLAGRLPFEIAELPMLKDAVLHGKVPEIPGMPAGAMRALRKAMAKGERERFGSCGEFVEVLAGALGKRCGRGVSWMKWLAVLAVALTAGWLAWRWAERMAEPAGAPPMAPWKIKEENRQDAAAAKEAGTLTEEKGAGTETMPAEDATGGENGRLATVESTPMEGLKREEEQPTASPGAGEGAEIFVGNSGAGVAIPGPADKNSPIDSAGKTKTKTVLLLPGKATMEMVLCQPGEFTMGSPKNEVGRCENETQHEGKKITRGFWIAKTEVTQAQWASVMENNPSCFKGDDLPVENVSWEECNKFCDRVSDATAGMDLRLPTEAEWEYACRAGSQTAYFWGNALKGDKANCNGTHPCGTKEKGQYLQKTSRVGSYPANGWGVHDMHGNVWEWCLDTFNDGWAESVEADGGWSDGPAPGHVLRGGAWDSEANYCRSACRVGQPENFKDNRTGFRPVAFMAAE